MKTNIQETEASLTIAKAFEEKYTPTLTTDPSRYRPHLYITAGAIYLFGEREDTALFGKVFGTDGWTRTRNGNAYDWNKTVDGVEIHIQNAEDLIVPTEVSPKLFPLMLTEGTEVV